MFVKPITGNFTYTQKLNGWASLIHLTKSGSDYESGRSSMPFVIDIPIVKIENHACHPPFLAIRRWKTYLFKNLYTGKKCHH